MRRSCFVLLMVCLAGLLVGGCNSKEERVTEEDRKANEQLTQRLLEHFARPDQERVALLARKYKQDPEVVESILDIYLTKTDVQYAQLKGVTHSGEGTDPDSDHSDPLAAIMRKKEFFISVVDELGNAYSIDVSLLSSLLIDYRQWAAAEESGSVE